ncbi:MAG: hypothetical protein Q8S13_12520 [Dehalococcoidia bacterium]|nr:hypothetical protein [Dehalococcoidia bacterium]
MEWGYALLRDIVTDWGGQEALARWWGCGLTSVWDRLHRKEKGGSINYAHADYFFVALTHPGAQERFVYAVCDYFGFERPGRRKKKSKEQRYDAIIAGLRKLGDLGSYTLKKIAEATGDDPEELQP